MFRFLMPLFATACGAQGAAPIVAETRVYEVTKTPEEWRSLLTADEFYVLRQAGTERAFTGDLWDHHEDGVYVCSACGQPLFDSATKFESGTGWPSYYAPLNPLEEISDYALGMQRTEVRCPRCGGHLGHVFDDGPRPTGQRYCMNSVSLDFVPRANASQIGDPAAVRLGGW